MKKPGTATPINSARPNAKRQMITTPERCNGQAEPATTPRNFEFVNGTFKPLPDPTSGVTGDSDAATFLNLGYRAAEEIGILQALKFWEGDGSQQISKRYPWACQVCPFYDMDFCVWIPDGPSLLQFLPLVAPLASFAVIDEQLKVITNFVERYFRAEHGHELMNCCDECDPQETERLRDARTRFQASKRREAKAS